MARELIDIILRIAKEGTGGRDAKDELTGIDKAAKKAQSGVDGLSKSWKMGMVAAAGIAGALATLKKAYDFGKEGAAILQTRDSFDRLMVSMGAGPDVLGKLQAASRGTVDDMTLMSSTMTLLAGTSETMGRAIVDASPRLMEIAKAANKLNPALGTTAQMYNSIATGVKRAQPLILDNLGLTIKVGEANEKYAASIGKTVEQLTAEEKTMAILAATLEAGDRMIQQVGGSTEAMGDSFAEAEVQIKNATDELKTRFAPVMAEAVGFLANMVTGLEKTTEATAALVGSADSYDVYLDAVLEVAQANDQLFQQDVDRIRQQAELGEQYHRTVTAMGILTEAEWNQAQETERVSEKWATYAAALKADVSPAVRDLSEDTDDLAGNVELVATMMADRAVAAADNFKASLDTLHTAIRGEYGDALDEYQGELAELEGSLASGTITQEEYNTSIEKATAAFGENTNAIIYNIAEKQILDALEKGLIEDVNASGTAYDEATAALWRLAEQTGLVDAATLELMGAVQAETGAFITGGSTANQFAGNLGALAGSAATAASEGRSLKGVIDSLHSKTITITTNFRTSGSPPAHEQGEFGYGGYQHGGQFMVRGPAGPDRVPVNFRATAGEVVTITPVGGTPPANPVTNNWNLTLNSAQSSQGVIRDFNIMQAMVG